MKIKEALSNVHIVVNGKHQNSFMYLDSLNSIDGGVGFEDVDDEMHDENDVATRGRRK